MHALHMYICVYFIVVFSINYHSIVTNHSVKQQDTIKLQISFSIKVFQLALYAHNIHVHRLVDAQKCIGS